MGVIHYTLTDSVTGEDFDFNGRFLQAITVPEDNCTIIIAKDADRRDNLYYLIRREANNPLVRILTAADSKEMQRAVKELCGKSYKAVAKRFSHL